LTPAPEGPRTHKRRLLGHSRENRIALSLLIFLIGASALAFGSVEVWAREWLRFGALLTLAAIVWKTSLREVFGDTPGRLALPVACLVLWGFVQTVPLPRAILGLLSPRTLSIYEHTVPPGGGESLPSWLLDEAEGLDEFKVPLDDLPDGPPDSGDSSAGRSLSVNPHATRRASLSWMTSLAFFLIAAHVAKSRLGRYRLLWGIAGWTGLLGFLALMQQLVWNGRLLWLREVTPGRRPLGPFVNPNNFAGYVELGSLVTLGLFLALLSRHSGRLDRKGIRSALVDRRWTVPRLLATGALTSLGLAGLLLSRSRGGLLAFAGGLFFLILARQRKGMAAGLFVAVVLLGVAVGPAGSLLPGLDDAAGTSFVSSDTAPSDLTRVDTWARTFLVFLDHPVTGTGLGTFQWSFLSYQRRGELGIWKHAHNDYLQFLSETGLVGALLMAWALAIFVRRVLWRGLGESSRRPRWTTIAMASAVFAMLVHSVVEFNLQVPANAALFSVLLGALTAATDAGGGKGA